MSIAMEEGRIINMGNGYQYEYHFRDHLGSLRAAFRSDQLTTSSHRADYTPFGRRHTSGQLVSSPVNRYLYSSKELQDGTGLYDYGARQYDAEIGRWGAVDPLADTYAGMTPYGFVGNDPINYLDPDGRKIDPMSQSYWDDEHDLWTQVVVQASAELAVFQARHDNGEYYMGTPIMSLMGLIERASGYLGQLENLKSSKTNYYYKGNHWSIMLEEAVVTGQQSSGGTDWMDVNSFFDLSLYVIIIL